MPYICVMEYTNLIYGLRDPRNDVYKYIGKTTIGVKRPLKHLIKSHNGHTEADITGLTASAMTVISSGCDYVKMSSNALFLIHNGWKSMTGNIYDFEKAVQDMSKTDAIMVKLYVSEAKKRGKDYLRKR